MADPIKTPEAKLNEESNARVAAKEELAVLEALAEGVSSHIAAFSGRPQWQGKVDNTEISLQEHKYSQLKAYEELADCCYGRTVAGGEVDEKDVRKGSFTYRITQANVGYLDKNCFVLARNSPLASALVTAQPGDEREVVTRTKERFFKVSEVRTFEGPVSLRRSGQKPNFRSMAIRLTGEKTPAVLDDIRSFVRSEAAIQQAELPRSSDADPTWLNNWFGIYLGESEELSLGHQFFTRTTVDQERALNNPRGLAFVEGIAGAGKTSVALGRLKFFANFATGAERSHYGLQNAPETDFSPVGMVGFVLSHSLKRYLRETAGALALDRLPIRDFEEFRTDLAGRFGIADEYKRKKGNASFLRSRISWLRAVDAGMARSAGNRLQKNLASIKADSKAVAESVSRIAYGLSSAEPQSDSKTFHLNGLAQRIVAAVSDAELRVRETAANEEYRPRSKAGTPQHRSEQLSLEREMRRIQQEADKKNVSPLAMSLLSGLTSHELLLSAVNLDVFSNLVQQSFSYRAEKVAAEDLNSEIAEIRGFLNEAKGRRTVDTSDLVNLVIMAAMIAEGFDYAHSSLKHLYQIRQNSGVFIDEVQDFTENEIVLMGMTASSAYHQITLSGDRCQRLQLSGALTYDDLFPWVPRSQHNRPIFLDHNFRQRSELAFFSSRFRSLIQNDRTPDLRSDRNHCATIHKYRSREDMSDFILKRIHSVPRNATIAVIAPTFDEAQIWFDLLEEELSAHHRPPSMSRRDDLTRRFNVHFTEVRETKGLEFNVVVVPDIGSFALTSEIGRNQAYVAISRPKHGLILGCHAELASSPGIRALERNHLARIQEIGTH